MAAQEFKGMVILDDVRWRLDDLERIHPDRVKDAVPAEDPEPGFQRVVTVPGGVVTGKDNQGAPVVDTTDSAAGNTVVVEATGEAVTDTDTGKSDAAGESGGSGDEGEKAGKRSPGRPRSTK